MPLVDPIPTTTLTDNLRRLGLAHTADDLNDLVARATQKRWSPIVLLETLAQTELDARGLAQTDPSPHPERRRR